MRTGHQELNETVHNTEAKPDSQPLPAPDTLHPLGIDRARGIRSAGAARGSVISLERLRQDVLIQTQICYQLLQTGILAFQLLGGRPHH